MSNYICKHSTAESKWVVDYSNLNLNIFTK